MRAGFKTIICNRPDSEDGAVPFDSLKPLAEAKNVPIIYQPVVSGALTDDDARQLAEILEGAEKPVLAYCRSGARDIQSDAGAVLRLRQGIDEQCARIDRFAVYRADNIAGNQACRL